MKGAGFTIQTSFAQVGYLLGTLSLPSDAKRIEKAFAYMYASSFDVNENVGNLSLLSGAFSLPIIANPSELPHSLWRNIGATSDSARLDYVQDTRRVYDVLYGEYVKGKPPGDPLDYSVFLSLLLS